MTDTTIAAARPAAGDPPLRVLVLAPQPFFQDRGTPIATRALLETLAARGYALDVLAYHEGEDVAIPGCAIHRIPAIPGLSNIRPGFSLKKLGCDALFLARLIGLLVTRRYALIHALEESVFLAMAAGWVFRVPYVYDLDSSLAQQMEEKYPALRPARGALEACEGAAVRGSLAAVAVCPALGEVAARHAPGKPVRVVEDFSLLEGHDQHVESLAGAIGRPGPIVLYVGNLEVYQGIDLLLQAFRHTLARRADAELVVIGGQPADLPAYRETCARLGIADHVHLLGARPLRSLGGYLRQACVVVSPRIRGQNTPMKVYSYLDSGRPLLATRLPTHTQVMDDSIAALAPAEPVAFGDALADLMADEARQRSLAAAARERVAAEFSPAAFRRKMNAFYDLVEGILAPEPWPLRLFRRSVIKQEKWRRVAALLPPSLEGSRCLDVGADNGVLSVLLRRRGGRWTSADLDEATVAAIRELVGEGVERLDGGPTPFPDASFDLVVIVDFLEHIHGDREFGAELARILAPGGSLIVNVPHPAPGSVMNRLRERVGLTDEKHGHVRPGYDLASLCATVGGEFALEGHTRYSRAFSESVDIALNALYEARRGPGPGGAAAGKRKGTLMTAAELKKHEREFQMLSLVYPLLWLWVRLDALLPGDTGHRLVARFRRAG